LTAASAPAAPRPAPTGRSARRGTGVAILGSGRLLRIELRHNAMLWLLPVVFALFWYNGYREIMALPPMSNLRAMTLQNRLLFDGLYTDWHPPALSTPWIWPARPPHDVGGALGAAAVFAAGFRFHVFCLRCWPAYREESTRQPTPAAGPLSA